MNNLDEIGFIISKVFFKGRIGLIICIEDGVIIVDLLLKRSLLSIL
jgi:hypothetical protein